MFMRKVYPGLVGSLGHCSTIIGIEPIIALLLRTLEIKTEEKVYKGYSGPVSLLCYPHQLSLSVNNTLQSDIHQHLEQPST